MFLELAEEARNIVIVDGRSLNVRTAQKQRTGRTDPVFVTEIVNNCPPLRDGARVANRYLYKGYTEHEPKRTE